MTRAVLHIYSPVDGWVPATDEEILAQPCVAAALKKARRFSRGQPSKVLARLDAEEARFAARKAELLAPVYAQHEKLVLKLLDIIVAKEAEAIRLRTESQTPTPKPSTP